MARLVLASLLASLVVALPAAANHDQDGIAFDHAGGNEWWVEVKLSGPKTDWWGPEVRDTNGEWVPMTHPSWASNPDHYVLSYHVEPGNEVQFRMQAPKSSHFELSCWFTHPAGVETCDGSETFQASFVPSGDSEVIRVAVDSTHALNGVHGVVVPGRSNSFDLYRGSGNVWERGGHVPDGTVMYFWTTSAETNDEVRSACYRWPSVTQVPCPTAYQGRVYHTLPIDGDWSRMRAWLSDDGQAVGKVDVRFDGGSWQTMAYDAASDTATFQGAPTSGAHRAQFRMTSSGGQVACGAEGFQWPSSGTYAPSVPFTFAEWKGNENWVQTNVYSSSPVIAVEAQVNNGAWQLLQQHSYCDWAKAISAPAGSSVRFRAFDAALDSVTSVPMAWPPGSTQPNGTGFDATFTSVKGNAWWVQANVGATGGTLAKVDVSLNGGAWEPLSNKGWGWAASYAIPEGTVVQLRATSTTGATDLSACYRWVAASVTACGQNEPGNATFEATFRNVRGNEWWVETDVSVAGGTLAGVDARVDGGAWTALAKRSYGSWAKSIHAAPGSIVEFRACATDGSADVSAAYRWPPG